MTTPIISATGSTPAEARAVIDTDSPAERDAAITSALVAYDWKPAVRVRAQAAVNTPAPGALIDGTAMVAGDRYLTNKQDGAGADTTSTKNGLYVWNGDAVPATRVADFTTGADSSGAAVKVNEGTDADKIYVCITEGTVGTTALAFQQAGFVGTIDNTTHGALSFQTPTGGVHHDLAVAGVSPGFMSAADKSKENAYAATYGAAKVLRGTGVAYADSVGSYPDTVAAGDLVCATGADVIGVVAGPGATVSVLKHTGSGGTNLPAHISLAGAPADAYKLLQANAAGNDYALDVATNAGHGGLGFQTLAAVQHHSNAVAGVSPGFLSAADKTKVDALPTVMAFCGTGADGAAVFTVAGAAVLGTTNVGSVYELTRDVNYTTVTVEAGVVVNCSGTAGSFFLRASTSITSAGYIRANGAAGANAGAGGGAGGAAGVAGTLRSGTAGGAGNNAGPGAAGAADVSGLGATGGAGGAGGNNVGANAGGAAGVVTAPTALMGNWQDAWAALQSFLPGYDAGARSWPQGGSGGGGGGSGVTNVGTTSNGGGGGAGGGILKIASPIINNTGGVISANGGAGGNGGDGTAGNDDGGGGGGGGGGGIVLVFRVAFDGNVPQVLGGAAGGHGHLMPAGTGADGFDGTVGTAGTLIHFTI